MLLLLACSQTFEDPAKGPSADTPGLDTASLEADDSATESIPSDSPPDSQVDTGPLDIDQDGYPASVDCNDHDAASHPGAAEIWYDGRDQDCLGGDDWDQDGDGQQRIPEGSDCDDTSPLIYAGAAEIWYDGIDSDCSGGSDFDQDADGEEAELAGGEDCDDSSPAVFSTAEEALGDGVDSDCDGGENTAWSQLISLKGAGGLQGPRLVSDASGSHLLVMASQLEVSGTPENTVGLVLTLEPGLGVVDSLDWSWGAGFRLTTGLDFWSDGVWFVAAYGLLDSANRYLVADVLERASGQWGTFSLAYATPHAFEDIALAEQAGSLELLGCESAIGRAGWAADTPAAWFTGTSSVYDESSGLLSTACSPRPSRQEALFAENGELATYSTTLGVLEEASSSALSVQDITVRGQSQELVGMALGADGLWVELDGVEDTLSGSNITRIELAVDSQGQYVLAGIDSGVAVLWFGQPGSWSRVELGSGLVEVEDLGLTVSQDDHVLIGLRGGEELEWVSVRAY